MGIIAWIVVGLIAGWLANAILGGRGGGAGQWLQPLLGWAYGQAALSVRLVYLPQ